MWAKNNKWQTSLQKSFHGKPLSIFARDSKLFLLQNEFRGSSLGWKDTFSIDDKGEEIDQMHRIEAWFQGYQWS
jgi:hypothetical protein